jgi:hypothetical protein
MPKRLSPIPIASGGVSRLPCAKRDPFSRRFSSVYLPIIDRFSPFLPFSEKRIGAEPHAARRCLRHEEIDGSLWLLAHAGIAICRLDPAKRAAL